MVRVFIDKDIVGLQEKIDLLLKHYKISGIENLTVGMREGSINAIEIFPDDPEKLHIEKREFVIDLDSSAVVLESERGYLKIRMGDNIYSIQYFSNKI